MARRSRRKPSGAFKAKVAVEAIQGVKTVPEIARQFSPGSSLYPNPKNLYLRVLAETGILGMVVYLALQASLLGEAVVALRRGAESWRFLGMAALCTWFALFFYNMTQDSFATPNLWLNLGILAGVAGQDHRAQTADDT